MQRMDELTGRLKEKKQILNEIESEIAQLEIKKEEIFELTKQSEQVIQSLNSESTKLDSELAEQEMKKSRALKQAEK